MITVVVDGPGLPSERLTFDRAEVTIGRVRGNDIVLARPGVSRRHARLVHTNGRTILIDLQSTNGTYINNRRVTAPIVVDEGDRIRVGDHVLILSRTHVDDAITVERVVVPQDPIEAQLVADITKKDIASRLVYADWLEERGHEARAEFLRVQDELLATGGDAPAVPALVARLRELAGTIDVQWRRKVARPVIEGCEFAYQCPRDWGSLAPTERSNIKHCGACNKQVHYCLSVGEARKHASRGDCVALDVQSARWHRDMEPPFGENVCRRCRADLGPEELDECPACGAALDSDVLMGVMA